MKKLTLLIFLVFTTTICAQNATIKGVIKNEFKEPIEGVAITSAQYGTVTNKKGEYSLSVPGGIEIKVLFTHVSYRSIQKVVSIPKNKAFNFSPTLSIKVEEIDEVIVKDEKKMLREF